MTKPIGPDDVVALRAVTVPDFVIDAFNACIAREFDGSSAKVLKCDVIDEILKRMPNDGTAVDRSAVIYRERWLDIEPLYRAEGWDVTYDKPGYNESYAAFFVFRRRSKP